MPGGPVYERHTARVRLVHLGLQHGKLGEGAKEQVQLFVEQHLYKRIQGFHQLGVNADNGGSIRPLGGEVAMHTETLVVPFAHILQVESNPPTLKAQQLTQGL